MTGGSIHRRENDDWGRRRHRIFMETEAAGAGADEKSLIEEGRLGQAQPQTFRSKNESRWYRYQSKISIEEERLGWTGPNAKVSAKKKKAAGTGAD
mmetsp:Transcript_41574/g.81483  ORF Transcript_41574/g.81483 Transcript_41574/m.81483 type:complete len:96 (+) Transcript_41574:268-555(+)|eukprot:CAMPEP_0194319374 /NCGR_PEP_ID=MMETSP0171-20130528/15830_1 /TAXON_ID=218684 /ORGANISM="Corethron pennatum, Strain L29A3" /LENGTH=95 /DNA_ID=CAMNT_0039076563 /DNA_START=259 /DNA_END=546 /DNA_ORIENTATION=-